MRAFLFSFGAATALLMSPAAWAQAPAPSSGNAKDTEGSFAPWPEPPRQEATRPEKRIEQITRGNRVEEVRVVGGQGEHRYTMVNREGRPPLSTQELSSGLSTPRFLKIAF
jgi:hypothetical protein